MFSFGFSKLGVMFGPVEASAVHHAYAGLVKPKPIGTLEGPSPAFVEDKVEFGRSRIRRWFD